MAATSRSAILTYHSLDDSGSVISIAPSVFAEQMEFLSRSGLSVVPLEEVESLPGSVALTFDDGFRNFSKCALPVLEKHRFPATLFVVSAYCGQYNDWPSGRLAIPRLPLLSWEELAALPHRITLGAHTATHRDLRRLPEDESESELRQCRQEIERRLGRAVRCLAYPYGGSSPRLRQMAASHYAIGVGTTLGFLAPRSDIMDLPRIDTYYLRGKSALARLFSEAGPPYILARRVLREARRFLLDR